MMMNVIFLITGFIFIFLLLITFYSKKTIKTTENKMFKYMIISIYFVIKLSFVSVL